VIGIDWVSKNLNKKGILLTFSFREVKTEVLFVKKEFNAAIRKPQKVDFVLTVVKASNSLKLVVLITVNIIK
jgi:hypothetical protein